jgi:hypothetical protein
MRIHPRRAIIEQATRELRYSVNDIETRHALTPAELVKILAEQIAWEVRYVIRSERHPNSPDTPGDLEG